MSPREQNSRLQSRQLYKQISLEKGIGYASVIKLVSLKFPGLSIPRFPLR